MGGRAHRSGSGRTYRPPWPSAATCRRSTKRDRALVLTLAVAEMLVRGGERIALLGLTPPTGQPQGHRAHRRGARRQRRAPTRCRRACRPRRACRRFSSAILFSDFLDPPRSSPQRLKEMAEGGVQGHLIQVLDPAEETLAYEGRMEFRSPEGGERWVADRVETLRERLPEEARRPSRRRSRSGAPARLVVPGPSHRPPRRRAAAGAHHAPAGHGRRLPLEACRADARRSASEDAA